MSKLVRQELFKLYKKKSTFILFGAVTLIMILISVVSKTNPDIFEPESVFTSAYAAYAWIVFIMFIQASTIITMEFQSETIKNLLYRNYTRSQVIISKCITLFIYSIDLYVITTNITNIIYHFLSSYFNYLHIIYINYINN